MMQLLSGKLLKGANFDLLATKVQVFFGLYPRFGGFDLDAKVKVLCDYNFIKP